MKTRIVIFKTLIFTTSFLVVFRTSFGQSKNSLNPNLISTNDLRIIALNVPNYMTPHVQFGCYNFSVYSDFFDTTATEMTLYFSIIEDNNGNEVFNDSITLTTNSLQILNLPNCFEPNTNYGTYTGYFNITSNLNDPDLLNNKDTIHFAISENTYANESGGTQSFVPPDAIWEEDQEPHSWAFGNFFHINYGTLESNYKAQSATFSLANTSPPELEGRKIFIYLYRWDGDPNEDGNMDFDERTPVAFSEYKITGDEQIEDLINVPFYNFNNGELEPIYLESNQNYVLMAEYSTIDQVDVEIVISKEIDYGEQIFLSEQLDNPRYAAMTGVNGDLSAERYSSIGFGTEYVPVVRLNLVDITVETKDISKKEYTFKLSPNPVSKTLFVEFNFPETQKDATIKIFDLNGRLKKAENYKNIKYEKINFDLTKFAAGTYFLQFVTDAGIRTERFVVHHF